MKLSRYIDVIVLAIGAAVAIPLGAPVGGYAIGAGTWLLQRLVAGLDAHLIAKITAPVKHLGYHCSRPSVASGCSPAGSSWRSWSATERGG